MTNANWQEPQGMMSPPVDFAGVPEQPSKWPTVIGVLSIVLGSLGILIYGCCGTIGTLMGPMFMGMADPSQLPAATQAQMDVMQQYMLPAIAANLLAAAMSTWLLLAGINLVRRRRTAVKLHVSWAIARILFAIPQNIFSFVMNTTMVEAMQKAAADSGEPMPPGIETLMASMGVVGMVIGIAWAAIWPVFVMIWFSRAKIKAEVNTWR